MRPFEKPACSSSQLAQFISVAEIVEDDFPILHGCQLVKNHRARRSAASPLCKYDRYFDIVATHSETPLAERSNRGLIEYGMPGALQYVD
jgi:hypothetical protein